jgi:6-phosphogluconolactonase
MDTLVFPRPADLFQAAAEDFTRRAIAAVSANNEFTVVLSGGNTAKFFFDALIESERRQQRIPWQRIKFFFGDERYVAADDAQSNYYSAKEHLFSKISVPAESIYRIPTEFSDPKAAAENYEMTIRKAFNLKKNEFPKFDLVYLGLGEDGHTASLMPGSDEVKLPSSRLVVSLWAPQFKMNRITLTPAALNHSACVCFLVTGENKASAVAATLSGPYNPQQHPAQLIQCADENIIWYLDQAAGKFIL